MLQNEVIVNTIENEIEVNTKQNEVIVYVEDELSLALYIYYGPKEVDILIHTEDLIRTGPATFKVIIQRVFTFSRSTIGNRKTFGQTSFTFTCNRVTDGNSSSVGIYGSGIYGAGTYGTDTHTYGSDEYGDGTYG